MVLFHLNLFSVRAKSSKLAEIDSVSPYLSPFSTPQPRVACLRNTLPMSGGSVCSPERRGSSSIWDFPLSKGDL